MKKQFTCEFTMKQFARGPFATGALQVIVAVILCPLLSMPAQAQVTTPDKSASGELAPPEKATAGGESGSSPVASDDPATEPENSLGQQYSSQVLVKRNKDIEAAFEKLKQNDRKGALDALKAAVAKKPDLPPAELLLARYLLDSGNVARGVFELDAAAAAHPQEPGVYLTLAALAVAQGRHTDATQSLEKAEKLLASIPDSNPRKKSMQFMANNHWATVHGRFERWPDARKRLEDVIKLEQDNALAHYRLAHVLFKLREGKQGYAEYQTAYKLNNKLPTPPIAVVMYYKGDNQPELAERWMAFAEKEYGQDSATRLFLGTDQWQKGDFEAAKRHAQAAAAADPNAVAVQFLLGVLAHYEGDLKTAEDRLEAAFKAAPRDVQIRDQLAKVLIQDSNPEKRNRALAIAQQSAQLAQNNRDVLATLGWILYNSGQTDTALQVLQAVTQGPIGGDSAYFVSRVLVDKKQDEDAKKLLENSLENKSLFVHRRDAQKLLKQLKS